MNNKISDYNVDAEIGNRLIEVKIGVSALRSVRVGLMQLAYALAKRPGYEGFLVLPDVTVTRARLDAEWNMAASVLRPELLNRLSLCMSEGEHYTGIPRDPDSATQTILADVVAAERSHAGTTMVRSDSSFVVLKVLLLHWLTDGKPVTTEWLGRVTGYSYPTIAGVLNTLGGLIERQSDRRIRLRWFPTEEFSRLVAASDRARSTVRFADRSGQARSIESHLHRLEKLHPSGIAIGGVLGAKHYFADLDLVGAPRLDISVHCPRREMNLDFIKRLDPALTVVTDSLEPASVVVHAIRHIEPFFSSSDNGVYWADPVECLLDLHEARLVVQANQFLAALQERRQAQ